MKLVPITGKEFRKGNGEQGGLNGFFFTGLASGAGSKGAGI